MHKLIILWTKILCKQNLSSCKDSHQGPMEIETSILLVALIMANKDFYLCKKYSQASNKRCTVPPTHLVTSTHTYCTCCESISSLACIFSEYSKAFIMHSQNNTHKDFTHRLASETSIFRLVGPVCHSLICIGLPNQSYSQSLLTSYGACSTKMKTLERTGSKSLQIVNLLNSITFQTTAQHRLRIGPF